MGEPDGRWHHEEGCITEKWWLLSSPRMILLELRPFEPKRRVRYRLVSWD